MRIAGLRLNDLSDKLVKGLLAAHPDWEPYLEAAGCGDDLNQCVRLQIPPPGDTAEFLWLDTEDEEVTIGFREWHTHSPLWGPEVEANVVEWSLDLLHLIMDEQVIVVICYRHGQWTGSSLVEAGDTVVPPEEGEARVFSWRGTHDRVITGTA